MTRGDWQRALWAHDVALAACRDMREQPSHRAQVRADKALQLFRRAVAGWTDRQLAALHRKTAEGRC